MIPCNHPMPDLSECALKTAADDLNAYRDWYWDHVMNNPSHPTAAGISLTNKEDGKIKVKSITLDEYMKK